MTESDTKKDGDAEEEPEDKMFRVMISDPEPKAVKMSRKKCVFVTITPEENTEAASAQTKMA